MIPRSIPRWQAELARSVGETGELLRRLALPPTSGPAGAASAFPLRVPGGYVARMRPGDPADPLLRQVLPTAAEDHETVGFLADPVADRLAMTRPGLLQKYRGRALLLVTGACPVHCRYCFRRWLPYGDGMAGAASREQALAQIGADRSLSEVILSGGDPLSLTDERLAALVARLDAIPHLRRLRVHTRAPIVLPSRVDERLLAWLSATRLRTAVVLHANHPNEIDAEVAQALARLASTGASLLNQSVLLRGVNDDEEVLASLSERLFEVGVLPYYLHQLDRVLGAAHFEVDDTRARQLLDGVRARLPGYLVPRLVREEPGRAAKTPL